MSVCYWCMENTGVDGVCTVCGKPIRTHRDNGDEYLLPLGAELDEGNVVVGEKLGRGGFGITYLARDNSEFGLIALKEFVPSFMINRMRMGNTIYIEQDQREQYEKHMAFFREEARTLSRLDHPNIVKVYFEFEENNTCYYAMERLRGRNLHAWLSRNGRMKPEDAFKLLEPVLDALDYIHSKKVFHRDISPGNIFLRDMPGAFLDVEPCLIDFGAAYDAQVARSRSAAHIKSKGFSPPEQNAGREFYCAASDIYAIAAVFYYMITGRTVEPSEDRVLYGTVVAPPDSMSLGISREVSDVVMRGIHLDRKERIQSVAEFCSEMKAALEKSHKSQDDKPPLMGEPVRSGHDPKSTTDSEPVLDKGRQARGIVGTVLDAGLFAGSWAAAQSMNGVRSLSGGNHWYVGLGLLGIALVVNLVLSLTTGGTLGECITGYARDRLTGAKALGHAALGTIYPAALVSKLMPPSGGGGQPMESVAWIETVASNKGLKLFREKELNPNGEVLGRQSQTEPRCDTPVSDSRGVSRRHCRIARKDDQWYIEDVGSKNHTYVNGMPLEKGDTATLKDGCRISLGTEGVDFIFHEQKKKKKEQTTV